MAKFVRGPFKTIEEVKDALSRLHQEGYSSHSITVVANRQEDLDALEDTTPVDVIREDADSLEEGGKRPFWEQLADTFSGYFFNDDYMGENTPRGAFAAPSAQNTSPTEYNEEDDNPRTILAGFKADLEDGKIVILVEDIENKEAKFNLDALDDNDAVSTHKNLKNNHFSSTEDTDRNEIEDADPSQVMNETITERDSHPDIENDEEVLAQETTYVPTDSDEPEETTTQENVIGVPPSDPDSIPTDVTAVDTDTDFHHPK